MRYFAKLAYKGTAYHGWQRQPNAITVQEVIEKSFATILRLPEFSCVGCGRTDTGVHASEYFLHFDLENEINEKETTQKINAILPNDIVVYSIKQVQPNLHARFDAKERSYNYFINTIRNPFLLDTSYFYPISLDLDKMNQAAEYLLEVKDFESFAKVHSDVKTTTCDVRYAKWKKVDGNLIFTITSDRFLRNMVRAVVGTLLLVGENKITFEEFKDIIASKNRSNAGRSVPGHGLFLSEIKY